MDFIGLFSLLVAAQVRFVVVGGLATLSGALYGAAFVQFAPNIAEKVVGIPPQIVYGIFLIGFMYIMPLGVAWFIHVARRKLLTRQRAKS